MYFFHTISFITTTFLFADDSLLSPHIPLNWSTCTYVSANCERASWLDLTSWKWKWNIFVYSLCPQAYKKLLSTLYDLLFKRNYTSKTCVVHYPNNNDWINYYTRWWYTWLVFCQKFHLLLFICLLFFSNYFCWFWFGLV